MNNLEWLYEHERDKLVKLLTGEYISCDMCYYRHDYPDCGGDCERNVREWLDDVHSEQIPDNENAALDSREKIEAEVRKWCGMYPYQVDMVWVWLNRQAEITEREIEKKWSSFSDSADGHIAELTNQLESAHAKNRALKAHIAKMQEGRHGWHIKGKELQQQVDTMRDVIREFRDERDHYIELFHEQERRANELQSRDANLAREIGTLRAERDRYRELCGKLLDAADDMRRVRDQFDAFTEVDR